MDVWKGAFVLGTLLESANMASSLVYCVEAYNRAFQIDVNVSASANSTEWWEVEGDPSRLEMVVDLVGVAESLWVAASVSMIVTILWVVLWHGFNDPPGPRRVQSSCFAFWWTLLVPATYFVMAYFVRQTTAIAVVLAVGLISFFVYLVCTLIVWHKWEQRRHSWEQRRRAGRLKGWEDNSFPIVDDESAEHARLVRLSLALELPIFGAFVAYQLSMSDIEKVQETRLARWYKQGLRILEDIPEVVIAAIDVSHFGGSYFAVFDITMSAMCILIYLTLFCAVTIPQHCAWLAASVATPLKENQDAEERSNPRKSSPAARCSHVVTPESYGRPEDDATGEASSPTGAPSNITEEVAAIANVEGLSPKKKKVMKKKKAPMAPISDNII